MARFKIIQVDPAEYKAQILEFWKEYLPGTPPGRFEWMQANPAGPAIWFFAFEGNKKELIGTVSIMPREMVLNKTLIKAGIVGDFMVSKNYRVFGPALMLQKTVLESMPIYGFDYFYTLPNQASVKINKRAGFVDAIKLVHYVKPVHSAQYIQKYLGAKLSSVIGYILDFVLKLFSKETWLYSTGNFDETASVNSSFDDIWDEVQKIGAGITGDHSAKYIDWRYFKNPVSAFRLVTLRSKSESKLLGYIIFSMIDGKIEIYDIISLNSSCKDKLLRKVIHVARREKCKAIYIRLVENSLDVRRLQKFMFFNAKDDVSLLAFGEDVATFNRWAFSDGDRNL